MQLIFPTHFWKQGIAPSVNLVIIYELIVVITFAVQCLVLWILICGIWKFLAKPEKQICKRPLAPLK